MNDYFFTLEVSDKRGGHVRERNVVISADNVENAYHKIDDELSAVDDVCRRIINVKKL